MAYVPPHLRNKQGTDLQAKGEPRSLDNLQKGTTSSEPTYCTLDGISALLGYDKIEISTLTISKARSSEERSDSEPAPSPDSDQDALLAIVLFEEQHPEWKSGHKMLCKSNLHVLHKLVADQKEQDGEAASHGLAIDQSSSEYPLFQEISFMKRKFEFAGWWRIQDVTFLAPQSVELVALFEKKFNIQNGQGKNRTFASQRGKPRTRTKEAWSDSLNREWAVVTLVRNHARRDLPNPVSNGDEAREELSNASSPPVNPSASAEVARN